MSLTVPHNTEVCVVTDTKDMFVPIPTLLGWHLHPVARKPLLIPGGIGNLMTFQQSQFGSNLRDRRPIGLYIYDAPSKSRGSSRSDGAWRIFWIDQQCRTVDFTAQGMVNMFRFSRTGSG